MMGNNCRGRDHACVVCPEERRATLWGTAVAALRAGIRLAVVGTSILLSFGDVYGQVGQRVLLDKWVTASLERGPNRMNLYSAEETLELRTADGTKFKLTLQYQGEHQTPGFGGELIIYTLFVQLDGLDVDKLTSGDLRLPYADGTVGAKLKIGEEDEFHVGAEVRNRRLDNVRFVVRKLR